MEETLAENSVVYGGGCDRRKAADRPAPQTLQIDFLSKVLHPFFMLTHAYRRHIFARCLFAINQVLPNYHHLKKPTKKPAVQAASWHQEGVSDRHSSGTDTQQTRMDRQAGGRQQTRQDSRNPDPHSGKYSLYFGWIQSIYIYIQIGISCWRCCFNYTVTMNEYSRYFLSPLLSCHCDI